jgi:tellurite resistance protein TerC
VSDYAILWLIFGITVPVMLALDLGVFHRKSHAIKVKEALAWSALWIIVSLLFSLIVYFLLGPDKALKFLTGYLVEKSLSIDNLFVFLLIFSYFGVPAAYQHKVLYWGIIGALVMRAIFIASGVALLTHIHWIIYIFGAFLIYSGVRMGVQKEMKLDLKGNAGLRLLRRFVPFTAAYHGGSFFTRLDGKRVVTLLFMVLVVIETTDVFFAVDSIPAILAISVDPFIVYTSNIFAILGLRALYFALAAVTGKLHYLHYGLAAILVFLGLKMVLEEFVAISIGVSLGVVGGLVVMAALASLLWPRRELERWKG